MAWHELDPDFTFHRDWVEKIIQTPPSASSRELERRALLTPESPTEHVLRGSKSFAARSLRSRVRLDSLHFGANKPHDENVAVLADPQPEHAPSSSILHKQPHVLGEIVNNGQSTRPGAWRLRASPTPSIRKSKIEALVKHHGSPQHVRVTAGGRIVPSEQSPLCHPRFGYSAIKSNGALIKVAPNHVGKAQWINTTQEGYVAQDINGQLCQIVNGVVMPLSEENGAVRLYAPAPNLNITQPGLPAATQPTFEEAIGRDRSNTHSQATNNYAPQPTIATQKNALDLEYSKLEQELKDLDKTEVLHGKTMAKTAKEALFTKRRELVTSMDRVRKALKSLKDMPQDFRVPTSPKAMRDRQPGSPPRNRLPSFLERNQHSNAVGAPPSQVPWQSSAQPVFGSAPTVPMLGQPFAMSGMPGPAGPYPGLAYSIASPSAFMPPPPFDGSMGAPYPMYMDSGNSAGAVPAVTAVPSNGVQPSEHTIPQHDGSTSSSNPKVSSPRQSHALPIKDPRMKQIASVKSVLNPMSPVYKPSSGMRQPAANDKPSSKPVDARATTPLAFLHASKPTAQASSNNNQFTSPTDKKIVVDGSSVSSVRTADFFPRNTRDYSLRKHEYPDPTDESEDKENVEPDQYQRVQAGSQSPITPKRDLHNTNWNPEIPDGAFVKFTSPQNEGYAAPIAPPGTPVNDHLEAGKKPPMLNIQGGNWNDQIQYLNSAQMPDRVAHNLSPKNKRVWRFIEEHPSRYCCDNSSSPARDHECLDELCVTSSPYKTVDFSNKSHEWIEGHQAGLYRKPVSADRMGDFLEGYCAGLIKSQPITSVSMGISDGSPAKSAGRRPTPSPNHASTNSGNRSTEAETTTRPPMELSLQSLDSLKQAVYAPQNENALVTPALNSNHHEETSFPLGAWQKRQEDAGSIGPHHPSFPQRASSLTECPPMPYPSAETRQISKAPFPSKIPSPQHPRGPNAPTLAPVQPRAASGPPPATDRITSLTSIDSTIHRPGPRIISPFEWKTPSSVAHAASLATGFFAHAQFDGTPMDPEEEPPHVHVLTPPAGFAGAPTNSNSNVRAVSLDGIESPPGTSPNLSPTTSPRLIPTRHVKKGSSPASPGKKVAKSPSPAKAKFEHIASKVGISVSSEKKGAKSGVGEEGTSPSKKGWRAIWHG